MPDTIIGQPIDRIDGKAKVTGSARYAGDRRAEHPAYGVIVTSTIGRGTMTKVDIKEAQQAPGVLLVMSHENAPAQAPFKHEGEDRHGRERPHQGRSGSQPNTTAGRYGLRRITEQLLAVDARRRRVHANASRRAC